MSQISRFSSEVPRILSLADLPRGAGGGKAAGLALLSRLGLSIPATMVILDARPERLPQGIEEAWAALGGGLAAVRSSGSNEDAEDASAAGQYETLLNVEPGHLEHAVRQCLLSAESERLTSYENDMGGSRESGMSVVIQKMIRPYRAGVLFSADPVSGNHEVKVVESVAGLGETLVSGHADAARYELNNASAEENRTLIIAAEGDLENAGLDDELLEELRSAAILAAAEWGLPIDLEWALDEETGNLYWLQSRPITALTDSLDSRISRETLITRCNIGEMMSGAATPLTLSTFGSSLSTGLAMYYRSFGALRKNEPDPSFIENYEDQLFMNLSTMYIMSLRVAGATREGTELGILGYVLPPHDIGVPAPLFIRLINGVRYFGGLFRWKKKLKAIEHLAHNYRMDCEGKDAAGILRLIESDHHRIMDKAVALHYGASAFSGAMNAALAITLSGGTAITDEANCLLTDLLAGVDGVESAAVLEGLEHIASILRKTDEHSSILAGEAQEVHQILLNAGSLSTTTPLGRAGEAYRSFIARHGHRCIREAELREPEWALNPAHLIESLRGLLLVPERSRPKDSSLMEKALNSLPSGVNKNAVRWITKHARRGVRVREKSKSMLIMVIHQFKIAARQLSAKLQAEGFLPEADLTYFLTIQELRRLVQGEDDGLVARARRRRRRLPERMEIRFPDLSRGKPAPEAPPVPEGGSSFSGIPVSRGIAEGPVRIVKNRSDAEALQAGEIMVAQYTDIGWSPFYGRAAGMITEIGGALSHGSVVAREYGLPLVGGLSGACSALETGMRVRLDGGRGIVTVLNMEKDNQPIPASTA